ncbi:hypothetical protein [Elstera cyanobacteriorum]|uniref:Uncharacterized protein n=1 Tax=Elstera cyanobacteriorum TaxID=2022747 RepID=A0A255XXG1_9PROT|nr:hypothetical protein [Elstera cyanobacteriorum]MCK6444606.1 hypothetical protein [Elstera cyanobacteriorum]OYQ21581.1 hypothetical protein CHR90_01620 [Elstera cyanobacteriorum]GGA00566.1 hypothetical protein GCM10011497_34060 [Elstera cyanobacteriorum]
MKTGLIDSIIGLFVAVLGIGGLFMASGAHDSEVHLFGLSLFVFAVLFNFQLIKGHFDRADQERHA